MATTSINDTERAQLFAEIEQICDENDVAMGLSSKLSHEEIAQSLVEQATTTHERIEAIAHQSDGPSSPQSSAPWLSFAVVAAIAASAGLFAGYVLSGGLL